AGFEALLRWDHPVRGVVPPGDFIAIAEETGLIGMIGEWTLHEACRAAARWPEPIRVAVNLSAGQLRSRTLGALVAEALAASGLKPARLELEVTETLLISDAEVAAAQLAELGAMGVRLVMDDFGAGQAALSHMSRFPFSKVKLDQSFLRALTPGAIEALVGFGSSLGVAMAAEGIEAEAELDAVRAGGCAEAQGFLFSPPLPASGVSALLGVVEAGEARRRVAGR